VKKSIGALALGLILSSGCARLGFGFSKIGDLLANSQNYAGKEILIRGTAGSAVKLPLVAFRFYSVRDATGEVRVRTEQEPPPEGTEVHVRGTLDTVAVIGGRNLGVHVREIERW
jgi:hypothetical protein